MTTTSLRLLAHFLNTFPPKGRVADYGGTDKIGGQIVKKMLALDKVEVIATDPSDRTWEVSPKGIHISLKGEPKKLPPTYLVLDYDNGIDLLKPIKGAKYDSGICMDLLEHTENPFVVAKNISDSLKKGALLFVTVPWVWEIHYHPKDYWRFAPQGLEQLFPNMVAITIEFVRDQAAEEELPRSRLVAVFKKK